MQSSLLKLRKRGIKLRKEESNPPPPIPSYCIRNPKCVRFHSSLAVGIVGCCRLLCPLLSTPAPPSVAQRITHTPASNFLLGISLHVIDRGLRENVRSLLLRGPYGHSPPLVQRRKVWRRVQESAIRGRGFCASLLASGVGSFPPSPLHSTSTHMNRRATRLFPSV